VVLPLGGDDPARVGDFRILGLIGSGGMGRVYLGRTQAGRLAAVKVIRAELADDPDFRERFRREVEAAERVGGAWTAPVMQADAEADRPWLATVYIQAPTLQRLVIDRGPLPAPSVCALGAGLGEALTAIHRAEVVHRDLKPTNVLLRQEGPCVIDFGISRALDGDALTRTGVVVGTPGFMSPEQVEGGFVGPASDVFSLGAVLVFAATGAGPFGTGSGHGVMYRVVHQQPNLSEISGRLREVAEACLRKEPQSRPAPADVTRMLAPQAPGAQEDGAEWLPPAVMHLVRSMAAQAPSPRAGSAPSPHSRATLDAPRRRTGTQADVGGARLPLRDSGAAQAGSSARPDGVLLGESPHSRMEPRWRLRVRRIVPYGIAVVGGLAVAAGVVAATHGGDGHPTAEPSAACRTQATRETGDPTPPALPSPGSISVNVYNATQRSGLAAQTAAQLTSRGFRVATIGIAPSGLTVSGPAEVQYGPDASAQASVVAAQIHNAQQVLVNKSGTTVDLILGNSFSDLAPVSASQSSGALPSRPSATGC
jgi:hypothetical protein